MDLELTEPEERFREELLDWLSDHLVGEFAAFDGQGGPCDDVGWDLRLAWDRELASGGWLGLGWPAEYGGRPATVREEIIFHMELARARAPYIATVNAIDLLGRTILLFGSETHKARFVPPILAATELWAQGFSEPNAGSDLANVATRAELDGDHWVVTGQKIWTSSASEADWLWVLCRTRPRGDGPGHKGLSMLLIPAHQPGVEVRTIRNMAHGDDLCEVFFDGATTSADLVLGDPHEGWRVAMGGLGIERGTTLLPYQIRFEHELDDLIAHARALGALDDAVLRHDLTRTLVDLRVLRMNNERILQALLRDEDPGRVPFITKVFAAELHQRMGELAMRIRGMAATVLEPDGMPDRKQRSFLLSRSETIYGGSAQIQRNIMGERVLGLPR